MVASDESPEACGVCGVGDGGITRLHLLSGERAAGLCLQRTAVRDANANASACRASWAEAASQPGHAGAVFGRGGRCLPPIGAKGEPPLQIAFAAPLADVARVSAIMLKAARVRDQRMCVTSPAVILSRARRNMRWRRRCKPGVRHFRPRHGGNH